MTTVLEWGSVRGRCARAVRSSFDSMSRATSIPTEPLPRFRLLAALFAAAIALLNAIVFAANRTFPLPLRAGAALAAFALAAWWLYGYRRGGFPKLGWVVDVALVGFIAVLSPMPAHAIALFFGGTQLRALFVPRRQLTVLVVLY